MCPYLPLLLHGSTSVSSCALYRILFPHKITKLKCKDLLFFLVFFRLCICYMNKVLFEHKQNQNLYWKGLYIMTKIWPMRLLTARRLITSISHSKLWLPWFDVDNAVIDIIRTLTVKSGHCLYNTIKMFVKRENKQNRIK